MLVAFQREIGFDGLFTCQLAQHLAKFGVLREQNGSAISVKATLLWRVVRAWGIEDSFAMDELYSSRFIDTIAARPIRTSVV